MLSRDQNHRKDDHNREDLYNNTPVSLGNGVSLGDVLLAFFDLDLGRLDVGVDQAQRLALLHYQGAEAPKNFTELPRGALEQAQRD